MQNTNKSRGKCYQGKHKWEWKRVATQNRQQTAFVCFTIQSILRSRILSYLIFRVFFFMVFWRVVSFSWPFWLLISSCAVFFLFTGNKETLSSFHIFLRLFPGSSQFSLFLYFCLQESDGCSAVCERVLKIFNYVSEINVAKVNFEYFRVFVHQMEISFAFILSPQEVKCFTSVLESPFLR